MDAVEGNENIGVFIGKCEFEKDDTLFWQLCVSVELIDLKNGGRIFEPVTSSSFSPVDTGSPCPVWNEVLACNHPYNDLTDRKNSNYVFLFELFDHVPEDATIFRKKRPDVIKRRIAWAFLKPLATNNTENLNQFLKLQLFKIGRNCAKTRHETCELYHFYGSHKRKKYPGWLEIEIRPVAPPVVAISTPLAVTDELGEVADTSAGETSPQLVISVSDWSRLPTQSCKITNSRYFETRNNGRGVSCVIFSNRGAYLAVGSFSKILLIDVLARGELVRFSGHTGLIYELAFAPDDALLLSVSADCSAMIWDVNSMSKTPLFVLPHASFVYCGKWWDRALITGGKDRLLRVWRHATPAGFELLDELAAHKGYVTCIEILADDAICSGDSLGNVLLWTVRDARWTVVRRICTRETADRVIDAIHCHPGQRRLVITARNFGSVMLDVNAAAVVAVYPNPVPIRSVSTLSPCGTLLFAFGPVNVLNCWRFDDAYLLAQYQRVFNADCDLSGCVAYHPFEHLMACGVLGAPFPCITLSYDPIACDAQLGLVILHDRGEKRVDEPPARKINRSDDDRSVEDKLAAIVRNIDRVLAAKRRCVDKN